VGKIMNAILEKIFHIKKNQSSIKTETVAGLTTFLAMSYIIFVNPAILSLTGMDKGAVFVATCLAAAFGSALMGLLANYPIALAPGMALNTYFTYGVVLGSGYSWQLALGAVFISGIIFLILSILPLREYLIDSIPKSLKIAIVAGIGLFLGVIGLKNAGIMTDHPFTFALANLKQPTVMMAMLGFFLIIVLDTLGVIGSIIISMSAVTIMSIVLGYTKFVGIFAMPPSLMPILLQMDIAGAFNLGLVTIVFAFLFVDLFDNTGTLIAIAHRAGFMNENGKMPRIGRVLLADSAAAIMSAPLGTSTTTSYLESAVGVKMGGRTGLMAVVVAILFICALFLSPLAHTVPAYATAPAIIYVACLMARAFTELNWKDATEYAPGLIAAITMPITFSIAQGISLGFISYTVIKIVTGRYRELTPAVVILSIIFISREVFF
jgi:AGZA family xanthine/uracil permease-like MFS transporter